MLCISSMKLTGVSYFLFHKTISQQYLLSSRWNGVVDNNYSTTFITLKMRIAINSVCHRSSSGLSSSRNAKVSLTFGASTVGSHGSVNATGAESVTTWKFFGLLNCIQANGALCVAVLYLTAGSTGCVRVIATVVWCLACTTHSVNLIHSVLSHLGHPHFFIFFAQRMSSALIIKSFLGNTYPPKKQQQQQHFVVIYVLINHSKFLTWLNKNILKGIECVCSSKFLTAPMT